MFFRSTALVILLVAIPGRVSASKQTQAEMRKAIRRLDALAPCLARVWPGFVLTPYRITYLDPDSAASFTWMNVGKSPVHLEQARDAAIDERAKGLFSFFAIDGVPAIVLRPGPRAEAEGLISTAVHEIFHEVMQRAVPRFGSRGVVYPAPWEPRHLRLEIIRYLRAAARGDKSALQRASFFYRQLVERFAADQSVGSSLDSTEGTAQYVGYSAAVIARHGCGQTKASFDSEMLKLLTAEPSRLNQEDEHYIVGSLATFILSKREDDEWRARVWRGEALLAVLFDKVQPLTTPDTPQLVQVARAEAEKSNRALEPRVTSFKDAVRSRSSATLAVSEKWRIGSYSTDGHVLTDVTGVGEGQIRLNNFAVFRSGSGCEVQLAGVDAAMMEMNGELYWFFPVSLSEVGEGVAHDVRVRTQTVSVSGGCFTSLVSVDNAFTVRVLR